MGLKSIYTRPNEFALLHVVRQAYTCFTQSADQFLLVRICQVGLLGRRDVEDLLLGPLLFCTDPAEIVHVVCDDAVDGAESVDDGLFLFTLTLFVVAKNGALYGVRGDSVLCEDLFDGLRFDFFLCHNLLVFCYVDVCFFFDVIDENVYRDICKLKRSFNIL